MTGSEITLSAVEYLNTKPFIEGLKLQTFSERLIIMEDTPAQCSLKLREGRADIGIVPVADYPELTQFRRITKWGIGADGPVDSVLLVANQPVNDLDRILLDYQSKTSNQLMRILGDEYFRYGWSFESANAGYEHELPPGTGAVIIGDRALRSAGRYAYRYDLAEAWLQMTGLPFLFAIWVASSRVNDILERELEEALSMGMNTCHEIAERYRSDFPGMDIYRYLTQSIHYEITSDHEMAMDLFLEKITMLEGII